MKTEQENWNTGFYTGFKQILTDLVIICPKHFQLITSSVRQQFL